MVSVEKRIIAYLKDQELGVTTSRIARDLGMNYDNVKKAVDCLYSEDLIIRIETKSKYDFWAVRGGLFYNNFRQYYMEDFLL